MAHDFGHRARISDEAKTSHENTRRYLNNQFNAAISSATTPLSDTHQGPLHRRTESDTIRLFQERVDKARKQLQESNEPISHAGINLTVDVNRSNIGIVPKDVVTIIKENVERLVLSYNQIETLPSNFSECMNLTYLSLRWNRFGEFPSALCSLQHLQVLDISRNELTQIPEEVRGMGQLRFLSVMYNRLQNLPYSLGFLEQLRLLKLGSNPLNEKLRNLVDSRDVSISPTSSNISDNEREAVITVRIKQYLKSEATTLESSAESSGESPLDTPKPLKRRSTALRFPVVPTSAGSGSMSDQRSPGFSKPPIPIRSHYRLPSSQNTFFPKPGFRGADLEPLLITNERNRSNSESVLQMTQNSRSKRMGIMSKQRNDLGPLTESSISRNSIHFRGSSYGSALKERRQKPFRSGLGSGSSQSNSPTEDRTQGFVVHRLSSVPELRTFPRSSKNRVVEAAKGLLFGLNQMHSTMMLLLSLTSEVSGRRSSLQRVYYNAFTHIDKLDQELAAFDRLGPKSSKRKTRVINSIRSLSKTCVVVFKQVMKSLAESCPTLLGKADQRYIRMLNFFLFYSGIETSNANRTFNKQSQFSRIHPNLQTIPKIARPPKLTLLPSNTIAKDRMPQSFAPSRRLRSDTLNSVRSQQGQPKPALQTQSAVPLYLGGRSRSNSRSGAYLSSSVSSLANTPRSGESFLMPGTPALPTFENGVSPNHPGNSLANNDALFEKIHSDFIEATMQCHNVLPQILSQLHRSWDDSIRDGNKALVDIWHRLLIRARQCMDMCDALQDRLGTVKLKDPEIRNSDAFWRHFTRFTNAFIVFMDDMKNEKAKGNDVQKTVYSASSLRPVLRMIKSAAHCLRYSPWGWAFENHSPPQTAVSLGAPMWGQIEVGSQVNGQLSAHRSNGSGRRHGDSLASPYMPTTPLSAALGPAAQATVPSSASSTVSTPYSSTTPYYGFDRSFQGDVFQRADQLLSFQPALREGRR